MRNFVPSLWEDFCYAVRLLLRSPGFTAAALITLAIGIGANTTVFSIVHGVLLRPLPFADSGRIATLWTQKGRETGRSLPLSSFKAIQQFSRSFEHGAAYQGAFVGDDDERPAVSIGVVSEDFFKVFRMRPRLGRDFVPDDLKPDTPRVAIISHEYWQSAFGGDVSVLGKLIDVPQGFSQLTIVGVLPADMRSPTNLRSPNSVWTPLAPEKGSSLKSNSIQFFGRLKAGVTFEQAQAEIAALQDRILPPQNGVPQGRPIVQPLLENFVASSRATILIFAGAVAAVLLIVIVNLVGLEMARLPQIAGELSWNLIRR